MPPGPVGWRPDSLKPASSKTSQLSEDSAAGERSKVEGWQDLPTRQGTFSGDPWVGPS